MKRAVLGVDVGTQGLTTLLVDLDDPSLSIVVSATRSYSMLQQANKTNKTNKTNNINSSACYEQDAWDWSNALKDTIQELLLESTVANSYSIVAIGLAGQMHGEVLVDRTSPKAKSSLGGAIPLAPVRVWCDGRNQSEANELSQLWNIPELPKRLTAARWLWTLRHRPDLAQQTDTITTPAGWLSLQLTGHPVLGIGDASGIFPMDYATRNYRTDLMHSFDQHATGSHTDANTTGTQKGTQTSGTATVATPPRKPIGDLLPKVALCGQVAGFLTQQAADWLGLPVGIPVAPAEGDQPASLVASLIGHPGMVACSFGTSVCANVVGHSVNAAPASIHADNSSNNNNNIVASTPHAPLPFPFCAVNGLPIYMVWLRNGTTFFNSMVRAFSNSTRTTNNNDSSDGEQDDPFATIMPQVLDTPADCGGLLAFPFLDDEPSMGVHSGGTASMMGWNVHHTSGHACKAALLSTMFHLLQGTEALSSQVSNLKEIILTGGLTKTPECGQIVANVFNMPVRLLEGSDEGCAWGAAVLAKYSFVMQQGQIHSTDSSIEAMDTQWLEFLASVPAKSNRTFLPQPEEVVIYQRSYKRYLKLLTIQSAMQQALTVDTNEEESAGR